jgi:transcriptional regulator with XRE-family HTH domain
MPNNLMSERIRAKLSREEVAKKIGRSEAVVGKWERGESSPLLIPDGVALAKLYGCTVDYLCGITEERTAHSIA